MNINGQQSLGYHLGIIDGLAARGVRVTDSHAAFRKAVGRLDLFDIWDYTRGYADVLAAAERAELDAAAEALRRLYLPLVANISCPWWLAS